MNTIERFDKLRNEVGIKADTPFSEALATFCAVAELKLKTSEKIITFLKDINGTPYTCPHCASQTIIERGNCHICDGEIAMPSTAIPQKAAPAASTTVKTETATTAEPKEKKTRTSKKTKEVAATIVEAKAAVDAGKTELAADAKPNEPVTIGKYDKNLPSLQSGLKQAQDKEKTKHTQLCQLAKDFSLQVPKPELTTASVLRAQVIAEFERLIAACPPEAPKKDKKAPKTVVVDQKKLEAEIALEDEDLSFDDDEDDAATVETTTDDDEDAAPPAKENKKSGKGKKATEKVVDLTDEEDATPTDDEEDFTLDDDDLAVDDAEVEDIVLEDDDEETDIED